MGGWRKRLAFVLEFTALGFGALLLLELVVIGLNRLIAPSAATVLNLPVLVAVVLWLGRFSIFGFLGARAAGRAGKWWLAVPAGALAVVAVALGSRAVTLATGVTGGTGSGVAGAVGVAGVTGAAGATGFAWVGRVIDALVADLPLLDWGIAAAVAVVGALVGPRIRTARVGERSTPLTVAGGVVAGVVAVVFGLDAGEALLEARARRASAEAPVIHVGERGDAQLEGVLRVLAERQVQYRRTADAYAEDPSAVELEPPTDVVVRISHAGPDGWAAVTAHASAPGAGCAFWTGPQPRAVTTPGGRPVPRDRFVCD